MLSPSYGNALTHVQTWLFMIFNSKAMFAADMLKLRRAQSWFVNLIYQVHVPSSYLYRMLKNQINKSFKTYKRTLNWETIFAKTKFR